MANLFDPADVVTPSVDDAVRKRRELESFLVLDVCGCGDKAATVRGGASRPRAHLTAWANVGCRCCDLSTATQSRGNAGTSSPEPWRPRFRPFTLTGQGVGNQGLRIEDLRLKAEYWLDEGRPPMTPQRRACTG